MRFPASRLQGSVEDTQKATCIWPGIIQPSPRPKTADDIRSWTELIPD